MVRRLRHRPLAVLAALALAGGAAPAQAAAHATRDPRHRTQNATIALAPRDQAGLAAYARAVSTPGSPLYHRYLTVDQFARRFAPTPGQVAAVRASLRAHGVHAGSLSGNGLALSVTGRSDAVHSASATGGPAASGLVQGVVDADAPAPTAPRPHVIATHLRLPHAAAAGCTAARAAAATDVSNTTSQIADRYGLSSLYAAGVQGTGVTVAVYELEPFSADDVSAFESCFHSAAGVSAIRVDGGAGNGVGSGEAAMDVEDVVGLAPQANVRVYEGPATGAGAYDTYARIVSDDVAKVVTTSWGLCEAFEGAGAARAESTLFQEAAVQGQTILASTGDEGSNDCANRTQSVDDPASQPWVTSVGATSIRPTGESVWNNLYGASGGGVSRLWSRPGYQTAVARPQSVATCGTAGTACREIPDVTADGDPDTGYVVYYDGLWATMGGTSISTPTWAAIVALADSSPACAGRTVGFANPALYALAGSAYATTFTDVLTGSNGHDRVPGFAAASGYDMASGLGSPRAASLIPALCGDSLSLAIPVAQQAVVGRPQRLALNATSSTGALITYAASGLPDGLIVSGAAIAGVPTTPGRYPVTITATDAAGSAARATFTWTIAPPRARVSTTPRPATITVARMVRRTSALGQPVQLRVRARDRRNAALRYSAGGLPVGLHIDPRTGLITGRPRRAGTTRATIHITDAGGATARVSFLWRVR